MLKPITDYDLGADDRAGVYIVLEHYEELLDKYHIGVFVMKRNWRIWKL